MNKFPEPYLNGYQQQQICLLISFCALFREITRLFSYYKVKNRARIGFFRGLLLIIVLNFLFPGHTIKYLGKIIV